MTSNKPGSQTWRTAQLGCANMALDILRVVQILWALGDVLLVGFFTRETSLVPTHQLSSAEMPDHDDRARRIPRSVLLDFDVASFLTDPTPGGLQVGGAFALLGVYGSDADANCRQGGLVLWTMCGIAPAVLYALGAHVMPATLPLQHCGLERGTHWRQLPPR